VAGDRFRVVLLQTAHEIAGVGMLALSMLSDELYSAVSIVLLPTFVVMISLAARKNAAILQVEFAHRSRQALNRTRCFFSVARMRAKVGTTTRGRDRFSQGYVS
jgi:hypothetical protein